MFQVISDVEVFIYVGFYIWCGDVVGWEFVEVFV